MCILFSQNNMNSHTLARVADTLLSGRDKNPAAPHYTEDSFRRKIFESNRRAGSLPLPLGGKESNYLLQSEWADVIASANLTPRQLEVLALRLDGHTFEEIGSRRGATKQGAQNVFFQAAKKLARAWIEYPYRGLSQVFREEVRRGTRSR